MSINSQFAVATHVLALLSISEEAQLTSEMIAGSVNTNPVVIRRIVGDLRRARLVVVQPGVGGGARLARSPKQITLLEVYQAVEQGQLFASPERQPNPNCEIGANIQATLEGVFDRAKAAMEKALAEVSVADILEDVLRRHHTRQTA